VNKPDAPRYKRLPSTKKILQKSIASILRL